MKFTFPIGCLALLLSLFAGDPVMAQVQEVQKMYYYRTLQFTENKGQWSGDFLYKADMDGGSVFLKRTGFMFLVQSKEDMIALADKVHGHVHTADTTWHLEPGTVSSASASNNTSAVSRSSSPAPNPDGSTMTYPKVRGHAYEVDFLNTNNPSISPDKAADSYSNYIIGNDKSKWASHVLSYQLVNYRSLYTGIDMQVYSDGGTLKYDLIVQPGDHHLCRYRNRTNAYCLPVH
jgi:hypothetical protein